LNPENTQNPPEARREARETGGAEVRGGGASAQGSGAVAAGASGVAVGGDVHGDIHIHSQSPSASGTSSSALRDAYLKRVMERCGTLSLTGIDPAAAGQRDTDPQLHLNAVYTALLTRSPRQEQGDGLGPRAMKEQGEKEPLRSALEQLDRQQRLVLQGDPGSGKSTFVNFVALCLAGEALKDKQANLRHLTAPLPDREGKDEKKLWKQTQLDESRLQCSQVRLGMLTEALLEHSRLPEFAESPAFFLPPHRVDLAQLDRRQRPQPTDDRREHPYRTADDQAGCGDLASGGTSLLMTQLAEQMLQVVVGPR
jgi:hypothetical protein